MQKGFAPALILVGVLVTAGLVGGAYYLGILKNFKPQPQNPIATSIVNPDSIGADWKTYNSPDGLYTFQYPESSNWYFYQQASPLGGYIAGVVCRNNCSNDTVTQFEVAPVTYKSVDEFINTSSGNSDFTRFTLNGDDAVKAAYAGSQDAGRSFISVFVVHKGQGYNIEISYGGLLNLGTLSQFPKANPDFFSTFKFTPASPSASQGGDQNQTSSVKTYTSPLGISFTYLENQNGGSWTIAVKESGNKICVTYDANDANCDKGQFVQVFPKSPTDSLQDAVTKQFLANYSPKDCFVSTKYPYTDLGYPSAYKIAVISFPPPIDQGAPWWQNANKCPMPYTSAGGVAYFLENTNHPDKFLFFKIGQYGIESDNNKNWSQTIKIL